MATVIRYFIYNLILLAGYLTLVTASAAELPFFTAEFDTDDGKELVYYRADLGLRLDNTNDLGKVVTIYHPKKKQYRQYWVEEKIYMEMSGIPKLEDNEDESAYGEIPQRAPCAATYFTSNKKKLSTSKNDGVVVEEWQCEHKNKSVGLTLQQFNPDVKLVISEKYLKNNQVIFEAKKVAKTKPEPTLFNDIEGFKKVSEEGFRQRKMRKAMSSGR